MGVTSTCEVAGQAVSLLNESFPAYSLGDALLKPTRAVAQSPLNMLSSAALNPALNGSLAREYWDRWGSDHIGLQPQSTRSYPPPNLTVLAAIVTRRQSAVWPVASHRKRTLALHLRLGDAMSAFNLSMEEKRSWCERATMDPPGFNQRMPHAPIQPYYKMRAYLRSFQNCSSEYNLEQSVHLLRRVGGYAVVPAIDEVVRACCALRHHPSRWTGNRIVLVSGVHFRGVPYLKETCDYLTRLHAALTSSGWKVTLRSDSPDADLVFLASAGRLLVTGGGYSWIAAAIAKQLGTPGIVMKPGEDFFAGYTIGHVASVANASCT